MNLETLDKLSTIFAATVTIVLLLVFAKRQFSKTSTDTTKPIRESPVPIKSVSIVLVHGAWVDGSGWRKVYDILVKDGYRVTMVQEPLTSLADDVAAARRVLDLQQGPVILVGHSYGGSIITEAGLHPNVVGLVFVAAYAPDIGESGPGMAKKMPSVLDQQQAIAVNSGSDQLILSADGFSHLSPAAFLTYFAPDLPLAEAEFGAQSQVFTAAKSIAGDIGALGSGVKVAAWKLKPSWGIIAGADQIINPNLERWFYKRANSRITEIPGASHSVYVSHAEEVAAIIEQAAANTK